MTNQIVLSAVSLLIGLVVGWFIATFRLSAAANRLEAERDAARAERERSEREVEEVRARLEEVQSRRAATEASLEAARAQLEEMKRFVEAAKQQMEGIYAELSQKALSRLSEQIKPYLDGTRGEIVSSLDTKKVEIAQMLNPLREMLDAYRSELKASEEKRTTGYGALESQIRGLLDATEAARKESAKVATALSSPRVSGSWGEQALRRCVELAGMTEYCDFDTQETFVSKESSRLRPDLVVRLPHKRVIAVDAKAPMSAYLEAAAASDDKSRNEFLDQHAKNLRRHIEALASREYHENITEALDFTVLFLGGEQFLYAALEADPSLFEFGAEKKVFIATPTVLIPLLRVAVAAWRTEKSEENAYQALKIGNELYERFVKVMGDIDAVGRALRTASSKYSEAVRSIETRLAPKARELQRHVESSKELPQLDGADESITEPPRLTVVGVDDTGDSDEDDPPLLFDR